MELLIECRVPSNALQPNQSRDYPCLPECKSRDPTSSIGYPLSPRSILLLLHRDHQIFDRRRMLEGAFREAGLAVVDGRGQRHRLRSNTAGKQATVYDPVSTRKFLDEG